MSKSFSAFKKLNAFQNLVFWGLKYLKIYDRVLIVQDLETKLDSDNFSASFKLNRAFDFYELLLMNL